MEKEYIVTGTPDEIKMILNQEFHVSDDIVDFAVNVLLAAEIKKINSKVSPKDVETLWYLNKSIGESRTSIFNTRHSVSFTDFGISFLKKIFVNLGVSWIKGNFDVVPLFWEGIVSLYESYHYVTDDECCVYFAIIRWKSKHLGQSFKTSDIFQNISEECTFLDNNWNCPFKSEENCRLTDESLEKIIFQLCEHNVLVQKDNVFDLKK